MRLVIRKSQLPEVVGLTYPSVRRLVVAGKFPAPRQLSDGSVGWLMSELQAWAVSRPLAVGGLRGEATRIARRNADATP